MAIVRYILRRLLVLIPVLIGITLAAFLLGRIAPGDPVDEALARINIEFPTEEDRAAMRAELGLDKPLPVQYINWLGDVLRGDLGHAYVGNKDIAEELMRRLPVTLKLSMAALVSAVLFGIGGGVLMAMLLQSVLRNQLAAPGVIGINSGAGLSALMCIVLFPAMLQLVPFAAFCGACISAFAVYLLARLTGASKSTIVLAGVAVNSILGACMDAIVTLMPDAVVSRSAFSIGGFANTTMQQLRFAAPLIIAALLAALLFRRELSVMALGDDVAHSLGLKVDRFRAVFLVASAMLAGAAVSFAGLIGFVGLISPHMSRMICKNDSHLQIPITIAFGASLCLICDLIARTAFAPYELPVGVVLSFLGAPFFLYLLLIRKKRSRHDEN